MSVSMRCWDGLCGGKYYLVQTMDQFWEFFKLLEKQSLIAVDTETNGLNWVKHHACGISIGWGVENNYYLPIAHKVDDPQLNIADIRDPLRSVFDNTSVQKIGWNLKFDRHMLKNEGIDILGVRHDGTTLVKLLDENSEAGLKPISKRFIHPDADKWEKSVDGWLVAEAKRRRQAFNTLVKEVIVRDQAKLEYEFGRDHPEVKFSGITRQQLNKLLKAQVVSRLSDNVLAHNKKDDVTYDYLPLDVVTPYACADVHYTYLNWKSFFAQIQQSEQLRKLYINETELSDVLYETERGGVKIDIAHLTKVQPEIEKMVNDAGIVVYDAVGYEFNIDSPSQLIKAFKHLGITLTKMTKPSKKTGKSNLSVDKDVLASLAAQYPFAKKVTDYREKQKLLNTYVIAIKNLVDKDHYLHSMFNPNVSTGRMSSSAPNVQNIPGKDKVIRRAFTVPEPVELEGQPGCESDYVFVFCDYSQMELRLTAHHSQDATLLAAYSPDAPGWLGYEQDVHGITCADVVMRRPVSEILSILADDKHAEYKDVKWYRNIAKRVNFGIIYGAGPDAIQRQVSTPERFVSRDECEEYINQYLDRYDGVRQWIARSHAFMHKYGFLQNTFGRYRRLENAKSFKRGLRGRAERQGVNFLIQGDAADLFKHSVVRVQNILREACAKTRIVNFVHDEIQLYMHKSEFKLLSKIKCAMEDYPCFSVPIIVDIEVSKRDWASKKPIKH